MRPSQMWLDFNGLEMRLWVDTQLNLAHARGTSVQRIGFFREVPLFHLPRESALPMGWISYAWEDVQGKFHLEPDFLISLEAARLGIVQQHPDKFLPPLALDFPLASDIVFYGGTFNPWHEGHESCIRLSPKEWPLIICPDHNPQKGHPAETLLLEQFLNLKKTIQANTHHPCAHVHPGFWLKAEPNPTVNWVLRLKHHRPDLRVHLLMGYDSFQGMSSWIQANDLVKLLSGVLVVSREEKDEDRAQAEAKLRQINPHLNVSFLGHHSYEHLSSTMLRKN